MRKYILFGFLSLLAFVSCKQDAKITQKLKDGKWHAEFAINEARIPFVFEVKNGSTDSTTLVTLINGDERVEIVGVSYKGDTLCIPITDYDTQLVGVLSGDTLTGLLKRSFAENDPGVAFKAISGSQDRFTKGDPSTDSIDGKWDIQFIKDAEIKNNVGIFSQKDRKLTGSILTDSGDLRYLEGVLDNQGFRLSAFAGLSPYLVQGKFTDKDHFEGQFITARGVQQIKGTRNSKATLADPYSLTKLNKGATSLQFSLNNLAGQKISLSDSKFKGKVVVVSILGSWCPNCLDEMEFLAPWYKENKDKGVEVVGLAFERKDDSEYVHKVLSNLERKYNPTYDILFAGKLGDESKVLPELDKVKSYPTTIFIDKKGLVRKIHTGFNGPATGLFYEEFKSDFNKLVDELLAEK